MKIELNRNEKELESTRLKITSSDGTEYRIEECRITGSLIINKNHDEDCSLNIKPYSGNQIYIK